MVSCFGLDILQTAEGDEVLFTYGDNGSGLVTGFEGANKNAGIGYQLIQLLTSQIKGRLSIKESNGFLLEIRFPIQEDESTFAT